MLLWDLEYSPYLLDIDVFTYPRLDISSATVQRLNVEERKSLPAVSVDV
jgi:hypothetical protein